MSKRKIADAMFSFATFFILYQGSGYWALLIFPYGLWNFYDGLTGWSKS